ncbi:hypothetical protein CWN80_05330 [Janibacter hoylei PVAS-1]|uniref:Uncharacterized protein n=1 Tax=Janibacter hoylei PVAS-1 TaxID=1210046 RepID=A0A444B772_9MICO|nr:hypothetical protein CWN80_05330 [Janibacter hoylei PVAS-1]
MHRRLRRGRRSRRPRARPGLVRRRAGLRGGDGRRRARRRGERHGGGLGSAAPPSGVRRLR